MNSAVEPSAKTSGKPETKTDVISREASVSSRASSLIAPIALLVVVLAIWQWAPEYFQLPSFTVPKFSSVAAIFFDHRTILLYVEHMMATLKAASIGFFVGSVLGFVSGVLLTESRILERTFYPYIVSLQCMPKVALAPLLVIWFGFGISSKIIVVALLCYFPVLVNTMTGIRSIDRDALQLFRAIRAPRLATLRHLMIPAALPSVLTGLEIALVVSLLGAIVGEFVGSEMGLGVLLLQAQYQMNMPAVFAILILLALMGVILNLSIRTFRRKALFWIAGEMRR